MANQIEFGRTRSTGLVEVLDRILDKGLFIGGDIKISLAEVELLTIRIRLIVCSLDKAREIGSTGGCTTPRAGASAPSGFGAQHVEGVPLVAPLGREPAVSGVNNAR